MAREGLQFTQDRLKAGSWDLSETSKSSSVSANAAGFCACERSAVFVAFRCTSGNRESGAGQGGQKSEWHICSKPAPRCKGRTASRWRACNPPNTHPPPQTPQTVCRGAVTHRAAKKREPCAANLPSLPQGAHPAARPRRKQAHAKQIIAQKQGNATKKANFAAKLRSACAEDHKTRGQSI